MPIRSVHFWLAVTAAAFVLLPSSARGDDWSQFRHDAQHTALGKDKLRLPLTDIWSQRSRGECATWKGRVFWVTGDITGSFVVCADIRTGALLWRRHLSGDVKGISVFNGGHVAVTEAGVLLVEDHISAVASRRLPRGDPLPAQQVSFVRAFRAADGALVDSYPGPAYSPSPAIPVIARDVQIPDLPDPRRDPTIDIAPVTELPPLGPFLIQSGRMRCLTNLDLLLDWTPTSPPGLLEFRHWLTDLGLGEFVHVFGSGPAVRGNSLPAGAMTSTNLDVGNLVGAEHVIIMYSYPLAASGDSLVVAGQNFMPLISPGGIGGELRQTFGMLTGGQFAWHYDYPFDIGIPTVSATNVLTAAGHDRSAVIAHDASTGAVRWTFAPTGLYPDSGGPSYYTSGDGRTPGPGPRWLYTGQRLQAAWRPTLLDSDPGLVLDERRVFATVGLYSTPRNLDRVLNAVSPYSRVYFNADPPAAVENGYRRTPGGLPPGFGLGRQVNGGDSRSLIGQTLVALDESTGALLWSKTLPSGCQVTSLIGTKDHLIMSIGFGQQRIVKLEAFRKEDGKEVWEQEISLPAPAPLAFADGLLLAPQSQDMTMFAPAERTFHLAVDSNRKEDYQYVPAPDPEAEAEAGATPEHDPSTVDPTAAAPEPPKPKRTAAGAAAK